jgi:hypothetical protein
MARMQFPEMRALREFVSLFLLSGLVRLVIWIVCAFVMHSRLLACESGSL